MFKKAGLGLGVLCAFWATSVQAGGAYCTADWRPENPDLGCSSQIAIAPGNDSRINLFLLIQDRAGKNGTGLAYPDFGWETFFGNNFMRWTNMRDAWYPPVERTDWPDHYGSRCQTLESGQALFSSALSKQPSLQNNQKDFLNASRSSVAEICNDGPQALSLGDSGGYFQSPGDFGGMTAVPGSFLSYVEGSTSFYAGDWSRASKIYADLASKGGDDWVKETALYMVARTSLNEAIESFEDEWGYFELEKANVEVAARAEKEFKTYLAAYPDGRYVDSATGLIRKSLWLKRDFAGLAPIYGALLAKTDPADSSTADLIEEVDDKFLYRSEGKAGSDALLLAADDLMRMRTWSGEDAEQPENLLSAAELDSQAGVFADHPQLYDLLKANHAFYVEDNYRKVLQLVPDAARADSYMPLAFSGQFLRGLALHALKDRNEEGFWLDLIKGSKGIWQRPAVELALARHYEEAARLDKVFAKDSPITDGRIRRILLGQSAGPDILKAQIRDQSVAGSERSYALFTALLKQLQHGSYAGFLDDYTFSSQFKGDEEGSLWSLLDADVPPIELFTKGKWSDGYACPSLQQTAQKLARNPKDVKGRLCLGDFYRLNGFDEFTFSEDYFEQQGTGALGDKNYYPGTEDVRHDFYTSIMNDKTATRDDRAYALYRAVRCYA
ncbi:MAG: hypothetical protein WAT93_12905, partial [Pontixanthobacter sp.]